jgi:hypothetical protein
MYRHICTFVYCFSHNLHILTLESGTVEINIAIKNALRSSEELVGYDQIFAELTALWMFIKREKFR